MHAVQHEMRLAEPKRQAWLKDLAGCEYPREADPAQWAAFEALSRDLADKHMPAEALDAVASLSETRGILVFENLPLDVPVMTPPTNNFRPAGKSAVSEAVHLGIIRHLAQVFGFQEEEEGALFHQIAPKAGRENTQSNGGVVTFHPHSDDAFLFSQHRPEFLSMFGLMNLHSAPTWVFPVEGILEQLAPAVIDVLQEPIFRHAPPESFRIGAELVSLQPVLARNKNEQHGHGWEVSFNTARSSGANEVAKTALTALRKALDVAPHANVMVGPGTLSIFSNLRHLHGRGAISGPRWLQRLYSRRDLSALRADTGVAAPGLVFPAAKLVTGYSNPV